VVRPKDDAGSGLEDPQDSLTEEDLILGKKATKFMTIYTIIALSLCVGMVVFAFLKVPWDTRLPYDGKYDRSGNGIPMQIAMFPILIVLVMSWKGLKKPDAHHMPKGSRVGTYILGSTIVSACIIGQFVFARLILTEGGYIPGLNNLFVLFPAYQLLEGNTQS
jgi:hypothetical protein